MKKYFKNSLMLALILVLSCFFGNIQKTNAQTVISSKIYAVQADYLKHPEYVFEFMTQTAEFWKKTYDPKYGGFFTNIDREGNSMDQNLKTTLTQSRVAYAFARAYMITGNQEYLKYARYAVDFLQKKCWDQKHGGFYSSLNRQGKCIDSKDEQVKWSFMQHYALLGLTAVYDAERRPEDLKFLVKVRQLLDEKLWDSRVGFEGYFEMADYDWSNPRGKGFTPTVDCITTHGLSLYLLTNEEKYRKRLIELGDQIVKYIYPTLKTRKLGFAESYDSDWKETDNSYLFIGHVLKTAWCLERIYLIEPKPEYKEAAEVLLQHIYQKGWDQQHGGPYTNADSLQGVITNNNKDYWTLEQAITAGLINYYVTKNPLYLKIADQTTQFYSKYIMDRQYGEVFPEVTSDGRVYDANKGSYYKSAYHHMETGYFLYLYGNLYLQQKPVSLYYEIKKAGKPREIKLTPTDIEESKLKITKVFLNNQEYTDFDAQTRILRIPAGVGGSFRVSFTTTDLPESTHPKLDEYLWNIEQNQAAMGSLSIFKKGREVYQRSFGYVDLQHEIKANAETKYPVFMASTVLTATIIMQLIEEQKLKLETRLAEFFPEIPKAKEITIEQLLRWRSGLSDLTKLENFDDLMIKTKTKLELLKVIKEHGSLFQPNEKVDFSISNYILLALIAEKVEQQEYAEILQKRITLPLRLKNTYHANKINPTQNEAIAYFKLENWEAAADINFSNLIGTGSIISTPTEINLFYQALFTGKVVSDASLNKMKKVDNGCGIAFFQSSLNNKNIFMISSNRNGYYILSFYMPDEELAFTYILNGNASQGYEVLYEALDIFFSEADN